MLLVCYVSSLGPRETSDHWRGTSLYVSVGKRYIPGLSPLLAKVSFAQRRMDLETGSFIMPRPSPL